MIDQKARGFEIFAIPHNIIETIFTGDYLMVADMIRELDQEGWVWEKASIVHNNRNT